MMGAAGMAEPVIGVFAGLEIAPGPLYYNGSSYEIKDGWNYDSYGGYAYGKNNGSTYFDFIDMGKLFESSGFSTSSGSIENVIDPLDGWRLPTHSEWASIAGTSRVGSTVNGSANKHYAIIELTGISHAGRTWPRGLLLFPDGKAITGKALSNMDNTTINYDMTAAELDVYLRQGCAFLPYSGRYYYGWGSDSGFYWSSTEKSSSDGYYTRFLPFEVSTGYTRKSYFYLPVRLVRPAQQ